MVKFSPLPSLLRRAKLEKKKKVGNMTDLQIIVLGLVQGITEFLPISSTAHLVLVPFFTGWQDQGLVFDIAVHVGTLLALLVYFKNDIANMIIGFFQMLLGQWRAPEARLLQLLTIATVPVGIAGLLLRDFIALDTRNIALLGTTSIVFGLLLGWVDNSSAPRAGKHLTWPQALVFGIFQVLALIPGTSRSGITMTAGRLMGFDREFCARFSMLMGLPVIALAGGLTYFDSLEQAINWQNAWRELLLGAAVAFVSAIAAIHFLLKLLRHVSFMPFVVYRIFLGALLLALSIQ